MFELRLYTTLGCHLCDEAETVLKALGARYPLIWTCIEIADDEGLVESYGIRIPVVQFGEDKDDIGWPFDVPKLEAWLLRVSKLSS